MKRALLALILVMGLFSPLWAEEPVVFTDAWLKDAVEQELWLQDPTPTDMLGLTVLEAPLRGITDLTGLEYAANLSVVELHFNQVTDLSPLAGLTEMQRLVINNNRVNDASALAALTKLEHLDIHDNRIPDISALAGLTELRTLVIRLNPISDLTPLAGLTALEHLDVHAAEVSDLAPLSGLTGLQCLILGFNHISDISHLSNLTALRELNLRFNTISDVSALTALSRLRELNLRGNQIRDISPLAEMTWLQSLDLESNEALNEEAYCNHLHTISDNGTSVRYDPSGQPPTGVTATEHPLDGSIEVNWNGVCNGPLYGVYYQVSRSAPPWDVKTAVSDWQTALSFTDTTVEPDVEYAYWVRTATSSQGDNPSQFSDPADMSASAQTLLLSSTAGGSITTPGEGRFLAQEATMTVTARPIDPALYFFSGWSGSAVDAGKLSDPNRSSVRVTVDADYALQAHFSTWMDVLYVDDNAPNDPGAKLAVVSDPQENGTASHPFDRIQEAIEVALDGTVIIVRTGTYRENIDLLGKSVLLTGLDPNGAPLPVIDGGDTGAVVRFTHGEDPNCTLAGFVISGGWDAQAAALACIGSSPTVVNCLIVGNRGAVYCRDSQALFDHCTIADNIGGEQGAAIVLTDSDVIITNSIVWNNAPAPIALDGDARVTVTHSDVTGGWPDAGNLDVAPLFARTGYWADPNDPAIDVGPGEPDAVWVAGDYHLKSQAGRWSPHTQTWQADEVTSPCIDAGDPAAPLGNEQPPHGNITNMGAYGGTVGASRSPAWLLSKAAARRTGLKEGW